MTQRQAVTVGVPSEVTFTLRFTDERIPLNPLFEVVASEPRMKLRALVDTSARWNDGRLHAIPAGRLIDVFAIRPDAWVVWSAPDGRELVIEPPLLVARRPLM